MYYDSDDSDVNYYTCEEDDIYCDCVPFHILIKVEDVDLELQDLKVVKESNFDKNCYVNVDNQYNKVECLESLNDFQTIKSASNTSTCSESTFSDSSISRFSVYSQHVLLSVPIQQPLSWCIDFDGTTSFKLPKSLQKSSSKTSHDSQIESENTFDLSLSFDVSSYKVLDLRRWYCMSRPQYSKSCGISSLVSVWNYLYSTLGTGELPILTQEMALHILGFQPPFGDIRFGPFTGNATLMKWFSRLNVFFNVKGRSCYMYKPKGRFNTPLVTDDIALSELKRGLEENKTGFIYHCLNHYFCPIGYEDTPQDPVNAYLGGSDLSVNCVCSEEECKCSKSRETWIFIREPSKKHPPFHCKRWSDILKDLHMESPNYYDIRRQEKGILTKNTKKRGTNLHCIIGFHKL